MLEAITTLSHLVEAVESGKESEVIIALDGKPAARLVPLDVPSHVPVRLGLHEGEYPPISLEEFNAMDHEIAKFFGVGEAPAAVRG